MPIESEFKNRKKPLKILKILQAQRRIRWKTPAAHRRRILRRKSTAKRIWRALLVPEASLVAGVHLVSLNFACSLLDYGPHNGGQMYRLGLHLNPALAII